MREKKVLLRYFLCAIVIMLVIRGIDLVLLGTQMDALTMYFELIVFPILFLIVAVRKSQLQMFSFLLGLLIVYGIYYLFEFYLGVPGGFILSIMDNGRVFYGITYILTIILDVFYIVGIYLVFSVIKLIIEKLKRKKRSSNDGFSS